MKKKGISVNVVKDAFNVTERGGQLFIATLPGYDIRPGFDWEVLCKKSKKPFQNARMKFIEDGDRLNLKFMNRYSSGEVERYDSIVLAPVSEKFSRVEVLRFYQTVFSQCKKDNFSCFVPIIGTHYEGWPVKKICNIAVRVLSSTFLIQMKKSHTKVFSQDEEECENDLQMQTIAASSSLHTQRIIFYDPWSTARDAMNYSLNEFCI